MTFSRILLLSLLSLGPQAQAQDSRPLSIDSCRALALQHNKQLKAAAQGSLQAEHMRRSTRALFLPDLSLRAYGLYDTSKDTYSLDPNRLLTAYGPQLAALAAGAGLTLPQMTLPGYDLDYSTGWVFTGGVVMKQPIYMGGKLRAAYAMARTAVEMARQNERLTEADVLMRTDEAFAQVVKAEEMVEVAQRYCALLTELERNVESAVRHGMRLENDRLKVVVKRNEAELQLRRAENGVRLARMNLCHITGLPLHTQPHVEHRYPETKDTESLPAADVSQRPEAALIEGQAQLAAQQARVARSTLRPEVALLAKYGYTRGLELNGRTLLDGWGFTGGVSVSVPIYHFGERTHKVKAAEAKRQQALLEREEKMERMTLELTQAANQLDEARLEAQLATQALAQAEQNLKLSAQQHEAGFETLSDYMESQALWQQAYQQKIEAKFRLYLSIVAYRKAAGCLARP